MTRVLFIRPAATDFDVREHARAISSLPKVSLTQREAPIEDGIAYILRSAGRLLGGRSDFEVVVTADSSSLLAAALGWRGPIVHLPVGRMTRFEIGLCRRLSRRSSFRLVTTSAGIARLAAQRVADVRQIRVLRPATSPTARPRGELRARLGVRDDQSLVYVPGVPRVGSNHRLSIWAANILYFRDPNVRLLIMNGGPKDAFVRRFITSAQLWPAVVTDSSFNEADAAAAADVAICAADGAPDVAPLLALQRAQTPTVLLRSTYLRERLHDFDIAVADEPKARTVARTALFALERGRNASAPPSTTSLAEGWSDLLDSLLAARP